MSDISKLKLPGDTEARNIKDKKNTPIVKTLEASSTSLSAAITNEEYTNITANNTPVIITNIEDKREIFYLNETGYMYSNKIHNTYTGTNGWVHPTSYDANTTYYRYSSGQYVTYANVTSANFDRLKNAI